MHILVTGHRGYIGAHAVDLFRAAGHRVTGVDIGLYDGTEMDACPPAHRDLTLDVFDLDTGALRGVDVVVHLAAISNDPMGALSPHLTHRVNTGGTMHVARCAKRAGVRRFLFASSCSVYGACGDRALAEDAPCAPVSAYAQSKVNAESRLRELESDDFTVVCLRNATAYGDSPRLRTDLVVNNLLAHAVTTGTVMLRSSGTSRRPLIHCRDIARAFVALSEAPRTAAWQPVVNVGGNDENWRIREVADVVHQEVEGSTISVADGAVDDPRDYHVSFDLLDSMLPHFRLRHSVRSTVRTMLRQYRAFPSFGDAFEGGRFTRLEVLRRRMDEGTVPGYFLESGGAALRATPDSGASVGPGHGP